MSVQPTSARPSARTPARTPATAPGRPIAGRLARLTVGGTVLVVAAGVALVTATGSPAGAAGLTTELINVNTAGQKADQLSRFPSVSETALIVAFDSPASNLLSGAVDTNNVSDIYVRYRGVPMTIRASVGVGNTLPNAASARPSMDAYAERVAFESTASNLVTGDSNNAQDIFVRNLYSPQSTTLVSVSSSGAHANGGSASASINKGNARYVAFTSLATNLVPGDANGVGDIFVRDLIAGTTIRASVSGTGVEGNAQSSLPSISGDGRYVAFSSRASNLVPGDTNGAEDVFVRDLVDATTTRVSVSGTGAEANGNSTAPSMGPDGYQVAFSSLATNLVSGDTNGVGDVFVHHRTFNTTIRASLSSTGVQGDKDSGSPSMGSGDFVAFSSGATNLVSGDTNGVPDVFRRNTFTGQTDRVSVAPDGSQAILGTGSAQPAMTANGQSTAFVSDARNLVPGDTLLTQDLFLRRP